MSSVLFRNIRKSFGAAEVIRGVNLEIADRELAVIVGPSGCGKSTLLRLIAGLEEADSGDLLIDGERVNDMPAAKRRLAMVFQSYALYPHMTVAQNLGFSLKLAGVSKGERIEKVLSAARTLQIEHLLVRKPGELSGGQRQRVAIGRAIVRNPRVFLFDEPLSNLDAALRVQMRLEIMRLREELNATMIYVTHDQVEAMTMADRIVVLREGVVEQVGSPLELYNHPGNLFVAGFIGSPQMNFIPAKAVRAEDTGLEIALQGGSSVMMQVQDGSLGEGEEATLGIRPEHIEICDAGEFRGEVLVVEHLGSATFLHIQTAGGPLLTVRAGGDNRTRVHDHVGLKIKGGSCHLFARSGSAIPRKH